MIKIKIFPIDDKEFREYCKIQQRMAYRKKIYIFWIPIISWENIK